MMMLPDWTVEDESDGERHDIGANGPQSDMNETVS